MNETPKNESGSQPEQTNAPLENAATPVDGSNAVPTPLEAPRGADSYTSKDMEHLSDREHVRVRPSMYIGDVGTRGLHHLVTEI